MNPYDDIDTLYDFLKSIKTIDEFFQKKEPAFNDSIMWELAYIMMEDGGSEEDVLSAFKAGERRKFAETLRERKAAH